MHLNNNKKICSRSIKYLKIYSYSHHSRVQHVKSKILTHPIEGILIGISVNNYPPSSSQYENGFHLLT